jgi:hypothetical protein
LSDDEGRIVGGKEQDGTPDLFGLRYPADRMPGEDERLDFRILKPIRQDARARGAGADRVDANTLADIVERGSTG